MSVNFGVDPFCAKDWFTLQNTTVPPLRVKVVHLAMTREGVRCVIRCRHWHLSKQPANYCSYDGMLYSGYASDKLALLWIWGKKSDWLAYYPLPPLGAKYTGLSTYWEGDPTPPQEAFSCATLVPSS